MRPRFLISVALVALALAMTGCSTIDSRIREKSAVFAALDPSTQDKVRLGRIEVGFSTDLVYMSHGAPDERLTTTTATGVDETWIYNSYHQEYMGSALVGYRRYVVIDPKTRQPIVFFEPVYNSIYRDRIEERIRIIFKDGKVDAIEQVKR
jgi:hypothetical protein